MNFREGQAVFRSAAAQQRTDPCGPSVKEIVGSGNNRQVLHISRPTVEFQDHWFRTDDAEISRGMIASDWFCRQDGWHLDTACLPEAVASVWGRLNVKAKRAVATNLVDDVPEKEIVAGLKDHDYDRTAEEMDNVLSMSAIHSVVCPVSGCTAPPFKGTVREARQTMLTHIAAVHPGFKVAASK